jgi:ubiquinone/menaquinone biosynthesis C-methylase UbiE/DNA-binding transcriptional ArsR family regulator
MPHEAPLPAPSALLPLDSLLAGLRAAGEETRLRVLALLALGDLTVTDLTEILGQSQPRISRHLKLLHEAGLVERYREGTYVFYALARDRAEAALGGAVLERLDRDDRVVARDRARLASVRAARDAAAADYFRSVAEDWDHIRSFHVADREVEAAIRAAVGPGHVDAHLDIGTGTGRLVELLAGQTRRAVGVDLSHDMLTVARANLQRSALRHVQVRPGDVYALPFEAREFDLVTIHQVLHYLEEPSRAIAEAARVLGPGGRLLVVDFAPHDLEFLRAEHAHRRLGFATEQMEKWLASAGLDVVETRHLSNDAGEGPRLTVTLWLARSRADAQPSFGVAA